MQSVTIPAVHPGVLFGRFFGTSDPTLKHQMFPPTEYFGSFGAVFRGCSPDLRQLPCESVLIPGSEKFCGFSHSVDYIRSETDSLRRIHIHRFLPFFRIGSCICGGCIGKRIFSRSDKLRFRFHLDGSSLHDRDFDGNVCPVSIF